MEHLNQSKSSGRGPRQIIVVLDFRMVLAIFALMFAAGWIDGYRQRGNFQRLEAQNARIIQLLEGAEITRERAAASLSKPINDVF